MTISKYQQWILDEMDKGACLQCNEGADYKAWLKYPDGNEVIVRRDSITSLENKDSSLFIYTNDGIYSSKFCKLLKKKETKMDDNSLQITLINKLVESTDKGVISWFDNDDDETVYTTLQGQKAWYHLEDKRIFLKNISINDCNEMLFEAIQRHLITKESKLIGKIIKELDGLLKHEKTKD